ncbi:hypothetical protein [Chitinophaga rhizophila]|uniref:Uncharacterized protein n=1 Tax=Chitinophaga rhizophila TaxID=2866212 RepID=A0ABS7G6M5_9BACT|nr:hypothetical protein [Chitinophaga rhizophila]MBW8683307.1 hypothetical protein [Chitinophaga rhizophila]
MKKLLTPLLLLITVASFAQDTSLPRQYYVKVRQKTTKINSLIQQKTQKSLDWFVSQEQRMRTKLIKADPAAAHRIFDRSIDSLRHLRKLAKAGLKTGSSVQISYNSHLDTLQVVARFLSPSGDLQERVSELQDAIGQSAQIGRYMQERQQLLKEQLSRYSMFGKELLQLGKQVYYYKEQVHTYIDILQDKDKATERAMALLRKSTAFKAFFNKHSALANLMGAGSAMNAEQALAGLQTRSQVERLLQQRIGTDAGARQLVTGQVSQAREQIEGLKEKFPTLNNSAEMPDFMPNPMKGKRLLQRIELGGNVQFQRTNNWFPAIGDIALQAAYKFNGKGSAGIGVAYKLGMGSLDRIALSSKGAGLRSFVDYRIRNAFSLNGGMEMNYYSALSHIAQLRNWNGWQTSALLGVRYSYKVSPKLKGNITLLYDFLARQQAPFTEPLKIRFGYSR